MPRRRHATLAVVVQKAPAYRSDSHRGAVQVDWDFDGRGALTLSILKAGKAVETVTLPQRSAQIIGAALIYWATKKTLPMKKCAPPTSPRRSQAAPPAVARGKAAAGTPLSARKRP